MKYNPCRLYFILKFLTDAYTCFNILGKQIDILKQHSFLQGQPRVKPAGPEPSFPKVWFLVMTSYGKQRFAQPQIVPVFLGWPPLGLMAKERYPVRPQMD